LLLEKWVAGFYSCFEVLS